MSYSMRRSYQDGNNSYHFKREEGESLKKVRIDSDDDTSGPSQTSLQNPRQTNSNMDKTYTFYTHKGGVGKTTCLTHMAIKAVHAGKRVLVVDCDPQLNSTNFFFRYAGINDYDFDNYYSQLVNYHTALMRPPHARTLVQRAQIQNYAFKHTNIWDILREVNPEEGIRNSFNAYEETGIGLEITTTLEANSGHGSLRLLGSHPMLGEMETYLAREVNDHYHTRDHSTRFSILIRFLIEKYGLDLVFVDLSPSSSFLNQNIILSSNYIILPCSADEFAYYSIKTIGMWLNSWATRHHELNMSPQVLTVVYNKYKRQGENRTEVVVGANRYFTSEAHASYIERLVGPNGAMNALVTNARFVIPGWNYNDIPLICDGLSTVSKLSSLRRTCYDSYNHHDENGDPTYHSADRMTCDTLREEYDRLWAKIEATIVVPEEPLPVLWYRPLNSLEEEDI